MKKLFILFSFASILILASCSGEANKTAQGDTTKAAPSETSAVQDTATTVKPADTTATEAPKK